MTDTPSTLPLHRQVLDSSTLHSGVFFILSLRSLSFVREHLDREKPAFAERIHLGTMPLVATATALCRVAWPAHYPAAVSIGHWKHAVAGAALAAGSLGSMWAAATALGWMEWQGTGLTQHPLPALVRSSLFFALSHAAVAYNEETVFRGHGLTVLQQSIGPWAAAGILIPLFASYHPLYRPKIAMSAYSLFAFNHTMMRRLSGSLAMPMAYHWTWNWLQLGVVRSQPNQPAFLPVKVTGPELWTGRLGEAYPGLLMVIVQGVLALLLGWLGWKARAQARQF